MTTKAKMSNLEIYQELSIQITTLNLKIDKVLELLNKPEPNIEIQPVKINLKGQVEHFNNTPPQWPNESRTDYLKRIGQYNEASVSDTPQSDDEKFMEEYK